MLGSASVKAPANVPRRQESDTGLGVLFDVGHPAQVHLFRNAIADLDARGHRTFVTSREKEVTTQLLDAYGIPHTSLSTRGDSFPELLVELATREVRLYAVARAFQPDVIVSRLGPVPAHVSKLVGCRNVAINDTHVDSSMIRRLYHAVTLPFVDTVCAPESFELSIDDRKRRPLDFQELAYLHPDYFEPDPAVLEEHGVDPTGRFFLLRIAGWDAYHDVGYAGLSPDAVDELVSVLSAHGTVYISAENDLPPELAAYALPTDPEDIHHVLHYADLYVGDSGTMSTEAAVLGTPAIRTNTMVGDGDENVFRELEDRYGLLRSFADETQAIRAVEQVLSQEIDPVDWRHRRERLLADQPNVTDRMVETILETAPRGLHPPR
jgi:predicted glycosyltransferase